MKIQPILDDKRCTFCNRFIPRGFVARTSAATARCVDHFDGSPVIEKPGTGDGVINPNPKAARREATMAAVRHQRQLRMEIA